MAQVTRMSGKRRWRSAACLAFCILLGMPVPQVSSAQRRVATPAGELSTQQQVEQLVVVLRGSLAGSDITGAGLIVAQRGDRLFIVTANHVLRRGPEQVENVEVRFRWLPGNWTMARVTENTDHNLDLAVLVVSGADQLQVPQLGWRALEHPARLASGHNLRPIGHPAGREWFVPQQLHKLASVSTLAVYSEGGLVQGHSGGVLVTEGWGVVGMLTRVEGLLGESARVDRILEKLNEWGYPVDLTFRAAASGRRRSSFLARPWVWVGAGVAAGAAVQLVRMGSRNGNRPPRSGVIILEIP